jgi:hypothetical protein
LAFHEGGQQGERGLCGLGRPIVLIAQVWDPAGDGGRRACTSGQVDCGDATTARCLGGDRQDEPDALSRAMATPAAE